MVVTIGPALIPQVDGGRRMRRPQATGLATGLPHFANSSANFGLTIL